MPEDNMTCPGARDIENPESITQEMVRKEVDSFYAEKELNS